MKLKTLKDLHWDYMGMMEDVKAVSKKELKQEAIKWVKELADRGRPESAGDFTMFFNIKEKDLK